MRQTSSVASSDRTEAEYDSSHWYFRVTILAGQAERFWRIFDSGLARQANLRL